MRSNNNTIRDLQLQYYGNGIYQKRFSRLTKLRDFFASIYYGNDEKTLEIEKKLTHLATKRNRMNPDLYKTQRKRVKEQLPYVVMTSVSDGLSRKISNIATFTGIMPLDFDKFSSHEDAVAFRDILFAEFPFILAAFLSSSREGVHALVKIPVVKNADEYKSYFWGLANEYFVGYDEFDSAPQNPVLPMFYSLDRNIKVNWESELWTGTGIKEGSLPVKLIKPQPIDISKLDRYQGWSISNAQKAINGITNSGHPVVVSTARVLGGRIGAGYLSFEQAETAIHSMITGNSYLQKGIKGYQKTASEMLRYGEREPLYF